MKTTPRFATEVILAVLMPWSAARKIRSKDESIHWLIVTVARLAAERDGRPRLHLVK